jgi:hypothetical protein
MLTYFYKVWLALELGIFFIIFFFFLLANITSTQYTNFASMKVLNEQRLRPREWDILKKNDLKPRKADGLTFSTLEMLVSRIRNPCTFPSI